MTSNNIFGLFPTRFQVTATNRIARIYARDEQGNMNEFTIKTFLDEGFALIMRRARIVVETLCAQGFDGLFTIGFSVTVKPMGPVKSTFAWESSALATEGPWPKGHNASKPRRFNNGRDFYPMPALGGTNV